MANQFNWALGQEGKGNVYDDGSISTWRTDEMRNPHHYEIGQQDEKNPRFHFYISPEGGLWDGGTTFNNQTNQTDDQVVKKVVEQHPAVWDGRNEIFEDYGDGEWEPEERVEMPGGGYGHAEDLMNMGTYMSRRKLASSGWADFHTEFKLPRPVRKQLRRWVDRLRWPENHEKHDAREYHITVLDMDEYDDDFAKWARKEVQGKKLHFKSTGMEMFNDFIVVRLDCPEWEELAAKWTEEAEKRGLEPHTFRGGPKAHVSVGRSPDKKWPKGVPNPHIKFHTQMFNIKRNSASEQLTNMFGESINVEPWEPGYSGKGFVGPGGGRVWKVDSPNDGFPSHSTIFDYMDHIPVKQWGEHPTFTVAPDGQMRFHTEENPTRSGYDGWQDALALHPALRPQEAGDTQIPANGYGHGNNVLDILNKQGMAADPEFINKWTEKQHEPYLYHGRQEHPDSVRTYGIQTGMAEYHPTPSVYMSDNPAMAEHFAENPGMEIEYPEEGGEWENGEKFEHPGNWVYKIDPRKLDPKLIDADEWNVQKPYPNNEEYHGEGWSMSESQLNHLEQPKTVHHQWEQGYPLAYRGDIPPEAIVEHWPVDNSGAATPPIVKGGKTSGADPAYINKWIEEHGPYMYHHTNSWGAVHGMLNNGIAPWDSPASDLLGMKPSEYEGDTLQTRPGHTYMRQSPKEWGGPQVRIDLRKLNTELMKPDEDPVNDAMYRQRPGWTDTKQDEKPGTLPDMWKNYIKEPWNQSPHRELGNWAEGENLEHPDMVQWSLERPGGLRGNGTLAYEGMVPPEAIDLPEQKTQREYQDWLAQQQQAQPVTGATNDPDDDLKRWFDSFTPQEEQVAPSPYHMNETQFTPYHKPPVVQTPHIDPPNKPYAPYNWAEEGWEESPMDRVANTHHCPRCDAMIDGQICNECGYDPLHADSDYDKAKNEWYDRAWSHPGDQPLEVPNQPMHWRDDHAKDVSLASRKAANGHQQGWSFEDATTTRTLGSTDDLPTLWHGELDTVTSDHQDHAHLLRAMQQELPRSASLGWDF